MQTEPLITELEKAEIRKKNFEESRFDANKQKYGLFSFTGTLAILPNSYEKVRRSRRNSEGGVITEPRNFSSSPAKKGKNPDALFSFPGFTSIGDKYKDPPKAYLSEKYRAEKMLKSHDVPFKPTGPIDMVSIPEHLPSEVTMKKRKRDAEGNVIFGPKNFYTSPAKRGHANMTPGVTFGGNFEHIPDPYDRKRDAYRKDMINSKAKMHEVPFKSTSNHLSVFNSDLELYHADETSKKTLKKPKPEKIAQHDTAFKPPSSVKSHLVDALFGKIPEFMSEPMAFAVKKSPSPTVTWKSPTHSNTRPSPSISTMVTNLRSEFSPLSFRQ